jgi:hypothetical protein
MDRPHIIERAFGLAGECSSMEDLIRKLSREDYSNVHHHFAGKSLRAQLTKKLNGSRLPKGRAR